jgi:hypothetical protein
MSRSNMKDHSKVVVEAIPQCDMCEIVWGVKKEAAVDGKTKNGPWANMCETCFKKHGVGLGTGKGQRYVKETI